MMEAATRAMGGPKPAGEDLASTLFGSNEVARQIAQQAAAAAGLNPSLMQQMQTQMAATLMAGVGKTLAEQGMAAWSNAMTGGAGGNPFAANPFGANPLGAWSEMMGRMMGAAAPSPSTPAGGTAATPPPMSDMLDPAAVGAMINRMFGGKVPEPEPEPEPPPPPPTSGELSVDALSQMVETGREVQEHQLKTMQSILETMFPPEGEKPKG